MKAQTVLPRELIDRCRCFVESVHMWLCWTLSVLAIAGTPSSGDMIRSASGVRPLEEARRLAGCGSLAPFTCAGPDECALLETLQQWRDENLPARTGMPRVIYAPVCDEFECVACVGYRDLAVGSGNCAVVGCLELHAPSLILEDEAYFEWSCVDSDDRNEMRRRTLERVDDLSAPPLEAAQIIEESRSLSGSGVLLVSRAGQVVGVPSTPGFAIFDLDSPPFEGWVYATFATGLHFRAQSGFAQSVLELEVELRSLNKEIDAAIIERAGCWKRRWSAQWPSHPRWEAAEWNRVAKCKSAPGQSGSLAPGTALYMDGVCVDNGEDWMSFAQNQQQSLSDAGLQAEDLRNAVYSALESLKKAVEALEAATGNGADPEKSADLAQDVADAMTRLSMLAGAAAWVLSDEQVDAVTDTLSAAGEALQDYQAASMPPVGVSTKSGEPHCSIVAPCNDSRAAPVFQRLAYRCLQNFS